MHRTLSSTSAVAVSAMVDLALQSRSGPVTLQCLGRRQKVSRSCLVQLFRKLRRHSLVRATRGPGGGYSLGRDVELISVADIVMAVDKPKTAKPSGRKARSRRDSAGHRLTLALWSDLDTQLMAWLEAMGLDALVNERLAREALPMGDELAADARAEPAHVPPPDSLYAFGSALTARESAGALSP